MIPPCAELIKPLKQNIGNAIKNPTNTVRSDCTNSDCQLRIYCRVVPQQEILDRVNEQVANGRSYIWMNLIGMTRWLLNPVEWWLTKPHGAQKPPCGIDYEKYNGEFLKDKD